MGSGIIGRVSEEELMVGSVAGSDGARERKLADILPMEVSVRDLPSIRFVILPVDGGVVSVGSSVAWTSARDSTLLRFGCDV